MRHISMYLNVDVRKPNGITYVTYFVHGHVLRMITNSDLIKFLN